MKAILYTDGACFGNPGPMGLGIVLEIQGEKIEESIPYGIGTNNIAEYSALIKGLELAKKNGVEEVDAFLDSQLVVKQVNNEWQVKDNNLKLLHSKTQKLLTSFKEVTIIHVRREHNSIADSLSKKAAYLSQANSKS